MRLFNTKEKRLGVYALLFLLGLVAVSCMGGGNV